MDHVSSHWSWELRTCGNSGSLDRKRSFVDLPLCSLMLFIIYPLLSFLCSPSKGRCLCNSTLVSSIPLHVTSYTDPRPCHNFSKCSFPLLPFSFNTFWLTLNSVLDKNNCRWHCCSGSCTMCSGVGRVSSFPPQIHAHIHKSKPQGNCLFLCSILSQVMEMLMWNNKHF